MRMHGAVQIMVALLVGFTFVCPASAGDVARAELLFERGKKLLNEGRYEEACANLDESYQQDPATGTLLALALCQERSGRLASACATYKMAAERAQSERQIERSVAATDRLKEIEPRLSKITIVVSKEASTITDLAIKCNRDELSSEHWGTPLALDGGTYHIEASAPGHESFRIEVTLGPHDDVRTITIPPLRLEVKPEPPRADAASSPPLRTTPPHERSRRSSVPQILTYVTAGTALFSFGLGTFFGVRAKSLNDKSYQEGRCDARGCSLEGIELRNQAISSARAATISLATGVLFSAASLSFYLVSESSSATRFSAAARGTSGGPEFNFSLTRDL